MPFQFHLSGKTTANNFNYYKKFYFFLNYKKLLTNVCLKMGIYLIEKVLQGKCKSLTGS